MTRKILIWGGLGWTSVMLENGDLFTESDAEALRKIKGISDAVVSETGRKIMIVGAAHPEDYNRVLKHIKKALIK